MNRKEPLLKRTDDSIIASIPNDVIRSQTDFPLLGIIISNGLLTIDQLEYFLSSGSSISESVRINHAFMAKLIDLEQDDPRLAQDNMIVEMNGPVTLFI